MKLTFARKRCDWLPERGALLFTGTVGDKAVRIYVSETAVLDAAALRTASSVELIRAAENLRPVIELAAQRLYEISDPSSFDGTIAVTSTELHGG